MAARRSDELLGVLAEHDQLTIVMHDNPDPDAIAAGWGLATLIEERLGRTAGLVGGGEIVRAENRHMVQLLSPPVDLRQRLPATGAVVLVDCGPLSNNHLAARESVRPKVVIDHHLRRDPGASPDFLGTGRRELLSDGDGWQGVEFVDLRPEVAATTTIAASYLREQAIEPGDKLATAMLYALRTETRGETHHTGLDCDIVRWLSDRADPTILAEIESAPLSRAYYADLTMALQSTQVYGDAAICLLPRAEGAEVVGELADLLARCQGVGRVLSGAVVRGDLLVSVRTKSPTDNAAQLVNVVLDGIGAGGGHPRRAGGKAPGCGDGFTEGLKGELRRRWLDACQIPSGIAPEPLAGR